MPTIEETTRTDKNEQRKPRNAYPIMKINSIIGCSVALLNQKTNEWIFLKKLFLIIDLQKNRGKVMLESVNPTIHHIHR